MTETLKEYWRRKQREHRQRNKINQPLKNYTNCTLGQCNGQIEFSICNLMQKNKTCLRRKTK